MHASTLRSIESKCMRENWSAFFWMCFEFNWIWKLFFKCFSRGNQNQIDFITQNSMQCHKIIQIQTIFSETNIDLFQSNKQENRLHSFFFSTKNFCAVFFCFYFWIATTFASATPIVITKGTEHEEENRNEHITYEANRQCEQLIIWNWNENGGREINRTMIRKRRQHLSSLSGWSTFEMSCNADYYSIRMDTFFLHLEHKSLIVLRFRVSSFCN